MMPITILAQTEISEIDSLETVIKTSKNDSIILRTFDRLRRITYYSDPKSSKQYTIKFLELAKKQQDSFEIALGNYYLGNSYVVEHNYEAALKQYLKSAKYFETVKDSARLGSILNGIGAAYQNYGNDSLSLKYYVQSQQISESLGNLRRSAFALNNIGNIYKNRGELDIAKSYMEHAVSDIETTGQMQYIIPISINLANTYTDLNNFKKATKFYNQILPKIDTITDVFSYGAILRGLGNSYLIQGVDNKKALYFLKRAYNKYSSAGFIEDRYDMMPDLIKAYEVNKKYADGLRLFNEYNTIKDSIFNVEKDKNLTEAIQKFETEKKDKEIVKQQLEIQKKNMQNKITIAIAVFLFLISILLWFVFKQLQKQKNQELIVLKNEAQINSLESLIEGEEKERLRIAKELHDGVNGDLSAIKHKLNTLLKLNNKTIEEVANMIDKSCEQVRAISHNLVPPALENFDLKSAVSDYCASMNNIHSPKIMFNYLGNHITLPKIIEINIFRIVQELVTNSIKHAKAKSINVQLSVRGDAIQLTVEDDGSGFDILNVDSNGVGITNINHRVNFLKGELDFTSNVDGTFVNILMDKKHFDND